MDRIPLLEPWPGPWEKWARNYCNKNLWRIGHVIGDIDDALGEAALVYVETKLRYGATVNSPAHFMRLFQISLISWVHTLSTKDSRNRQTIVTLKQQKPYDWSGASLMWRADAITEPDAEIAVLLNEGSSELKQILKIFLNAPQEVMDALRREASSYSPRQFFNKVLAFAGINQDRSAELQRELTTLLTPERKPKFTKKEIVMAAKFVQQLVQVKQAQ